jgi:hypothetical protein
VLRLGAPLPLSGPLARFGHQAAAGLQAWAVLQGPSVRVQIADCTSDPARLPGCLRELAGVDLLLGPYASSLTRAALETLQGKRLLWNHGGAADDVQEGPPGRAISILTPASRYARPLIRRLVRQPQAPLVVRRGRGRFAAWVAEGAERLARLAGLEVVEEPPAEPWDLLVVGGFEEDVAAVRTARRLSHPPRHLCAVAAGTREFAAAVAEPGGIWGLAQWLPGGPEPRLGPTQAEFLPAYRLGQPDYPAVQACAAAALARRCAEIAGGTDAASLWAAATALRTRTLFGTFAVDRRSGAQRGHRTVLTRWRGATMVRG